MHTPTRSIGNQTAAANNQSPISSTLRFSGTLQLINTAFVCGSTISRAQDTIHLAWRPLDMESSFRQLRRGLSVLRLAWLADAADVDVKPPERWGKGDVPGSEAAHRQPPWCLMMGRLTESPRHTAAR